MNICRTTLLNLPSHTDNVGRRACASVLSAAPLRGASLQAAEPSAAGAK